jgi:hypothetical protein
VTRLLLAVLLGFATVIAACESMPGWDGRYATRDRGGGNRGGALTGLPVKPYTP